MTVTFPLSTIDDDTPEAKRRERLLRLIKGTYSSWENQTASFRAVGRSDLIVIFDDLPDAVLERFRDRILRDYWFAKRRNRLNRAIWAMMEAA